MTRHTRGVRAAVAAGAILAAASPALAQADPGRMFRGLFAAPPVAQTTVSFASSAYEGYDSTSEMPSTVGDDAPLSGGLFSAFTPSLVISHVRRRTSIGLSAANVVRYYHDDGRLLTLDRGAAFGVRHAWGRTALQVSQTVNHRPYYELLDPQSINTPGLGGLAETAIEQATARYGLTAFGTSFEASRHMAEHQWLSAGYRFRYTRPSVDEAEGAAVDVRDVVGHEASVAMMRQISSRFGLRASYAFRTAGDPLAAAGYPTRAHELNIGFDRFQSFSLTRNTTLSMTTGTGLLNTAEGRQFTLLGSATLNRRFGRASRAAFSVRRGIEYLDGLNAPALNDGASFELDASLGRRATAQIRGSLMRGSIEQATGATPFRTAFGSARLRFDFTRHLAGYAEYFDFYRSMTGEVDLPLVRGSWNRHGVRVGVIFDVPLYSDRGVQ